MILDNFGHKIHSISFFILIYNKFESCVANCVILYWMILIIRFKIQPASFFILIYSKFESCVQDDIR